MVRTKNKIAVHNGTLSIILLLVLLTIGIAVISFFSLHNQEIFLHKRNARHKNISIRQFAAELSILEQNGLASKRANQKKIIRFTQKLNDGITNSFIINDQGQIIFHPLTRLNKKNIIDFQNQGYQNSFRELEEKVKEQKNTYHLLLLPTIGDQAKEQEIIATWVPEQNWIICTTIQPFSVFQTLDSRLIPLFSGVIVALILVVIYLTQFHTRFSKKSKKLLETEQKYQTLFNSANDGILLIEKYRFVDCNYKALEIFGTSKDELIGATPDQYSPEYQPDGSNSYDKSIDIIDKSIAGEKQYFEWKHIRKDGEEFHAEVSVNKVNIASREMILAIVRDITPHKLLEEKLIKAKNKAEESDRLKSAFLANTSHEIRTPMNAIMGFSRLLQSENLESAKRIDYTNNIIEKGEQLLQIINDIIDVSKIEANQLNINKSRFSLNSLMDEIYNEYFEDNKENQKVVFFLEKEAKNSNFICMDQNRLKQILHNLLSNAFKYTDEGKIEFGYKLQDKDTILFFVKDSGIGIDKEKQPFIFDSFRKSDTSSTRLYGGTGLGLSISKALVELMGGEIWVESNLNKGAAFYFTLPYEPAHKVNEPVKTEKEEQEYLWENKTILIVEDDVLSFEYLKEILKETKASILHAKDGQSAIEQCKSNTTIDLVLMDIQLPGIDGNTATKKIRVFNKDLPIIAQTAYALEDEKNKILEAGCNDYVSKPINEKNLYRKIHNYLGQQTS
jgi:PAS domain S-box-containing protein